MRQFPVFLDLDGRPIAVFGGGPAALSKVRLLLGAGAEVTVVAERIEAGLAELHRIGRIRVDASPAGAIDLVGRALVIAAAGDPVDVEVAGRARGLNIPVNVVDRADLSTFIMPAIVDRGEVVVAISTGGDSPVLARRLRERIEALLPRHVGALASLVGRNRRRVAAKVAAMPERRRFWERIVDGPVGVAAIAGMRTRAEAILEREIARLPTEPRSEGTIHIVGAGPGDPELLTLKALRALQDADVILYDALVSDDVLDRARRDAERVLLGGRTGKTEMPQDEINRRIVDEARKGRRVVRLRGGDPAAGGPGGEEAEAAREAGLSVTVVPGVTATLEIAAEAEIAFAERKAAAAFAFADPPHLSVPARSFGGLQ